MQVVEISKLLPLPGHRPRSGRVVAETDDARQVLDRLTSKPKHVSSDRFKASPRPNKPDKDKPTTAQKRVRRENIKKAQAARHAG